MSKPAKVLTTLLLPSLFGRAQQRVAQQRIDSKLDLGRIVDIRKKVFSEVKVSSLFSLLCGGVFLTRRVEICKPRITNWR
jgi:hypothetical protein